MEGREEGREVGGGGRRFRKKGMSDRGNIKANDGADDGAPER